ncbi:hypothetical protein [Microbacterium murale]|uniref:Uncharacterized protein n=1 Tax=Microbacterium murale TaxID=1081040 RepID=A0ABQ1RSD1_9MICO|nr:hypothetical protein [Microbacterium murale]GGD76478.1 hypothetical protein GCM10007269_19350 [Microbacterium murale]
MIAFFAALIPIVGSLYAAGTFLTEQARLAHERRVRERIAPRIWAEHERQMERAKAREIGFDEVSIVPNEFERRLLTWNGIEHPRPTYGDMDINVAMSAPLLPASERRRQWVLLVSASAGAVLLAIDASVAAAWTTVAR